METNKSDEPEPDDLARAALESYRSTLLAMGKSGQRACPAIGSELQRGLAGLEKRLSTNITVSLVRGTERHVEEQLHQWAEHTAEYFKTKASDIKELLLVMASTAEGMGERDQRYAKHFSEFTTRLQSIADLEDLAQVRTSLVQRATELRDYVNQMAQDSSKSVALLRADCRPMKPGSKPQNSSPCGMRSRAFRIVAMSRNEWSGGYSISRRSVWCFLT
jgi:hypothetical protein